MAQQRITMPKLGAAMTEGTLVAWLCKPGDSVVVGQAVAQVETDKAVLELESEVAGTVAEILEPEGAVVAVGADLVRLS